jgi:2-dehydro-3-deoxygluconokinase
MSGMRVVCFGELLVRLSAPDGEPLLQTPNLGAHVGGAEANVAVSLARFGHAATMLSVVPRNALGAAAVAELRRHGVGTDGILSAPGRMGLYFLTPGAVTRPAAVLYDRAGSAFALAASSAIDWAVALRDASWLHCSGITSAVGANAAAANQLAADTAVSVGANVSFDCNYREQLWQSSGRDPRPALKGMLASARLACADDRDIALVLGAEFAHGDPLDRRRAAAAAAVAAFPRLERLCSTIRDVESVQRQRLSGVMFTRAGGEHVTRTHLLDGIVDRVGSGDAFTAGILHGLLSGNGEQRTLELAAAAAALKHSVRGDFNVVDLADVEQLAAAAPRDIRR